MFASEKNTESIKKLFLEFKRFFGLQKKLLVWNTAEKLTVLLAAMAIVGVMLVLAAMALLYFTFALAYYIGSITDNLPLGFACVGGILVVMLAAFYALRNKLVIQPLARFIAELFINKKDNDDSEH